MDLKRQPYMLRHERQKSIAMDRKIKELEEKALKQSMQVRQLMLGGNTLRYSQNNQQSSPVARIENEPTQSKTQTARKRPTGEDYLKYSERMNTLPSTQDPAKKGWEPPPVVNLPPRPQEKQEDKQMQYLKSQEYRKYLQKLSGNDSKEDKVKYMKQNRNHNIYLGDRGIQKRDYIQAMLKSKQVLPRVNRNYRFDRQHYPQRQMTSNSYRRSISPLPSYRRQNISRYQYEQVKQIPKQNRFFESPIKEAKNFYEGDAIKKQASSNGTLILSPICIKKVFKQEQQAQKENNYEKIKPIKKRQQKRFVKQFDTSQKQTKMPIQQKMQKVEKKSNIIDHKERQPLKNNQNSAKLLVYKKEIQFTDRKLKTIERCDKKNRKQKYIPTCRYKIIPEQSLSQKSISKVRYSENSSSFSSNAKSPSKNKKDIYNVSFKLDMPRKMTQKIFTDINKKQPNYQQKHTTIKNSSSERPEPYRYYEKQPNNNHHHRYYQNKQWIELGLYYEKQIRCNYKKAQKVGLEYSQTQSATTIQTEKPHCPKSPRKISVVSKSKMK